MRELISRRGLSVLLAGFALAAATTGWAEDSVRNWLDRMSRAVETLDYKGTLVHVHNGQVDTLKIVHRADDSGVRQRIYSIDGARREVIRSGDSVRCFFPGDIKTIHVIKLAGRIVIVSPYNR